MPTVRLQPQAPQLDASSLPLTQPRPLSGQLRALETFDCAGTLMPRAPAAAVEVALEELRRHAYTPPRAAAGAEATPVAPVEAATAATAAVGQTVPVWVAVGGLVFDVSSNVAGRAMLGSMSGGDGTAFVLRMWLAAFGDGPSGAQTPAAGEVVRVAVPPPPSPRSPPISSDLP